MANATENGSAIAEIIDESHIRVWVDSIVSDTQLGKRKIIVRYGDGTNDTVTKEGAFEISW